MGTDSASELASNDTEIGVAAIDTEVELIDTVIGTAIVEAVTGSEAEAMGTDLSAAIVTEEMLISMMANASLLLVGAGIVAGVAISRNRFQCPRNALGFSLSRVQNWLWSDIIGWIVADHSKEPELIYHGYINLAA